MKANNKAVETPEADKILSDLKDMKDSLHPNLYNEVYDKVMKVVDYEISCQTTTSTDAKQLIYQYNRFESERDLVRVIVDKLIEEVFS